MATNLRPIWRQLVHRDGRWSGCRMKLDYLIVSTGLFLAVAAGTVSALQVWSAKRHLRRAAGFFEEQREGDRARV